MKRIALYTVLIYLCSILQLSAKEINPSSSESSANNCNYFIKNVGQIKDQFGRSRKDIDFKLEGNGVVMFTGDAQLHYQWNKQLDSNSTESYRLDVELIGANKNAQVIAEDKQAYYENFYLPQCPEGITAHSYKKIIYKNVYPYIDWVIYSNDKELKYDFLVHKGGNPADIHIQYNGATRLALREGSLIAVTPFGSITENAPYSYWAESKNEVATEYVLNGNVLSYKIALGLNQKKIETNNLIIDPILNWTTYYGGTSNEIAPVIATDTFGNIYTAGSTQSVSNIAISGAHQFTYAGSTDGFLIKFDINGNALWATYYGGSSADYFYAVTAEPNGDVYVGGYSVSSGLTTTGAHQIAIAGNEDGIIVKFNAAGMRQWATYYGGTNISGDQDRVYGLSFDATNNYLYVVGSTNSSNNIATSGAYITSPSGNSAGMLLKFTTGGSRVWGTYYNGFVYGVANDNSGNVFVVGFTGETTGIATLGAHQSTISGTGATNAFLGKFNAAGSYLWGTYYGANGDYFLDVVCDAAGDVYVSGTTSAATGIATPGANQSTIGGGPDGMVARFSSTGTRIWSTYCGSTGHDNIIGLTMTRNQQLAIVGFSPGSTITSIAGTGAYQSMNMGQSLFFMLFNLGGTWQYGSYFKYGFAQVTNQCHKVAYAKGRLNFCGSNGTSGLATTGAYQTTVNGLSDALITQFMLDTSVYFVYPRKDTVLCAGQVLKIQFDVIHNFRPGNTYTIQLSDTGGSFASPVTLTTITGQFGGSYSWTVPTTILFGIHYKLRIITTTPATTTYSDFNLSLQPVGPASVTISSNPSSGIKKNMLVTFTAAPVNGGSNPTFQWKLNGVNVSGATNKVWSTTTLNDKDSVKCAMSSNMECATVKDVLSNTLIMDVSMGIEQINSGNLKVYPNPVNETLNLEGLKVGTKLQLVSVLGIVIYNSVITSTSTSINVKTIPDGSYFIVINDTEGNKSRYKIIKD